MNLVSIIMNCHNGEKFLAESLKSVFNQTYKNWEIIFFDNVSNDNSKEILKRFNDKRIKYFRTNKLLDLYKARNLAVEKCNGDYISFLDTDDLWTPDKLEKQISFVKENTKFRIVYSNYYVLENKKKKKFIKHKMQLPFGSITQKLLDYYSLGIATVLLEKSLFEKFKFNETYNVIGDFDFFIKLSQKFEIGSIQEPLAFYRLHGNNFSTKRSNIYIEELEHWISQNEKEFLLSKLSLRQQKTLLIKLKIKYFFNRFFGF